MSLILVVIDKALNFGSTIEILLKSDSILRFQTVNETTVCSFLCLTHQQYKEFLTLTCYFILDVPVNRQEKTKSNEGVYK